MNTAPVTVSSASLREPGAEDATVAIGPSAAVRAPGVTKWSADARRITPRRGRAWTPAEYELAAYAPWNAGVGRGETRAP